MRGTPYEYPLSRHRLALRQASTAQEYWVCSFRIIAEANPALLTLKNMEAIIKAPHQQPVDIATQLTNLFETSPTLIQQKYIDLLINLKEGPFLSEALCHLFFYGSALLSPENIAVIRETASYGKSVPDALIHLFKSSPSLLTDENRCFIVKACKHLGPHQQLVVPTIAKSIGLLFKADPALLHAENYMALLDSAEVANQIEKALSLVCKYNPALLTQKKFEVIIHQGSLSYDLTWYEIRELEGKSPHAIRAFAVAVTYGLLVFLTLYWWKGAMVGIFLGVSTSIFLGGSTYLLSFYGSLKLHENMHYNKKFREKVECAFEGFFSVLLYSLWTLGYHIKNNLWYQAPGVVYRWIVFYPFGIISYFFNFFLDMLYIIKNIKFFFRKEGIHFYSHIEDIVKKLKEVGEKEWVEQLNAAVRNNVSGKEILASIRNVLRQLKKEKVLIRKLKIKRSVSIMMLHIAYILQQRKFN